MKAKVKLIALIILTTFAMQAHSSVPFNLKCKGTTSDTKGQTLAIVASGIEIMEPGKTVTTFPVMISMKGSSNHVKGKINFKFMTSVEKIISKNNQGKRYVISTFLPTSDNSDLVYFQLYVGLGNSGKISSSDMVLSEISSQDDNYNTNLKCSL